MLYMWTIQPVICSRQSNNPAERVILQTTINSANICSHLSNNPPKESFYTYTRNTCTQHPLARFPNLFSVMVRLHAAINRADFVSRWMWFNGSHTEIRTASFSEECISLHLYVYKIHQDTKSTRLIALCKRTLITVILTISRDACRGGYS